MTGPAVSAPDRTPGPDQRPVRNNLPVIDGYRWRARTYPYAVLRLAQAEAVHGKPPSEAK